jgi:hypothetical protein
MSDVLCENKLDSDTPILDTFIYHRTSEEKAKSILRDGFDVSIEGPSQGSEEEFLKAFYKKRGSTEPIDRAKSAFFYPNIEKFESLSSNECLIVVDASEISNLMYMSDMAAFDDIISVNYPTLLAHG